MSPWTVSSFFGSYQLPAETLFPGHLAHHALLHLHAAAATHHLEHFSHLRILPQQVIDLLPRRSRARRDPLSPTARDNLVVLSFLVRHRVDDRFHPRKLLLVDVLRRLRHARERSHRR